jgi:chaperonin GroES
MKDISMLKPIKNNVIVELIEKEKVTSSGIILKSADPAEVNKALVLAIGPDVTDVAVNDIVLPNWNKAAKTSLDGQDFYVINQDEIVGVFDADNV